MARQKVSTGDCVLEVVISFAQVWKQALTENRLGPSPGVHRKKILFRLAGIVVRPHRREPDSQVFDALAV